VTLGERNGTLGTFTGVFTPSILTILGIILFLRLGFVVGDAGLRNALLMIGLATVVSTLTSISLAAIATNIEVKGGGDYYLISRTLGVEFGGAIGIVLYLAQTVSIAFYAVGFGEVVAGMAGWTVSWGPQVIAAAAVLFLFWFAWAGADVASRFQFVVMALLVGALISFFVGAIGSYDPSTAADGMTPVTDSLGFWVVFAIFFPAVTGFTQGVSMSGDLRNPGKSLPRGTFAAVGLSTVVYVAAAILMAGSATQQILVDDGRVMRTIAGFGPLIDAGVIAATLSSAMASFLGAPRILQSLAADRVFPILHPFAAGDGVTGNPRRGVLLSMAIALATIALGSLNAIAPVVSMFFLISYGLLNYATYYEARAMSPSFRPRFRFFSRRASLIGAVACLGSMLAISPIAGGVSVLAMYFIYRYLLISDRTERWTDASRAHFFHRAMESIRAMTGEVDHPRNWRPQILAFSADRARRARLLQFALWLEGGSGFTAVAQIITGEGALKRRQRDTEHHDLESQIEELGLDVHVLTVLAPDAMEALPVIVQTFGLGPMAANTVVFGLPSIDDESRVKSYVMALRSVSRLGVNTVAVSSDEERWAALAEIPRRKRIIDVWWTDDDTGRLSLLTAYLCTRTAEWSKARIRLVVPITGDTDSEPLRASMVEMLDVARITADVVLAPGEGFEPLLEASSEAALVMAPMVLKGTAMLEGITRVEFGSLIGRLPLVAAITAGKPVDIAAGPETGPRGDLRRAEERCDEVAEERISTLARKVLLAEARVQVAEAEAEAYRSSTK